MKESLHLQRPTASLPEALILSVEIAVQLRTVEHYQLIHGLSGDIDPDLGVVL